MAGQSYCPPEADTVVANKAEPGRPENDRAEWDRLGLGMPMANRLAEYWLKRRSNLPPSGKQDLAAEWQRRMQAGVTAHSVPQPAASRPAALCQKEQHISSSGRRTSALSRLLPSAPPP